MNRKLDRNQSWKFHLLYISFVFSLVYMFGLAINLKLNILFQILLVSLGSLTVKFFLLNPLILYAILAIGFLIAFLVNHFITPFFFSFLERVYFLFYNIIQNFQGKENISLDNVFLFWGLLIILASFFTAFILFKGKSIYCLPPVYIGFFLYYWYTFFNEAYWMFALFLLTFFIFLGLDKNSKKGTNDFWASTVITYSILVVCISILLPKNNNYISWPWLYQKIYSSFPGIEDLRHQGDPSQDSQDASLFNFSITGFQKEASRLGGPVVLSDEKVMYVYANSPNYLRGNVKQIYTGNSWETIDRAWGNYIVNQDFGHLSKEDRKLYYQKSHITITNQSLASTTLFSPYIPTKVTIPGNYSIKKSPDNALVFPKGIYNDESYKIQVEKPLPYGVLLSLGIDIKKEDINSLDTYLQIPDEKISEATRALVKEIVKDQANDFEKAVAIENHLRNNYEYSLDVNVVPENQEFIDYFLFDEQKGYCTYYATSMALMLRLEGIPSRYIEGYIAKDLIKSGVYEVRQENAHAWVEAFIEPVGWMKFEATPGFSIEARLEDYEPIIEESLDTNPIINDDNNMDLFDNIQEPTMYGDEGLIGGVYNSSEELPEDSPLKSSKNIVINILKILLLIIPIKFLINFFKYMHQEGKSRKLSKEKRIIYLYTEIINILGLLGSPQQSGETHSEYASRVAYRFLKFGQKGIKEITEIFVKTKYGNNPTSDTDIEDLEVYRKSIENNLKNHWGPVSYYYKKYIKGLLFFHR